MKDSGNRLFSTCQFWYVSERMFRWNHLVILTANGYLKNNSLMIMGLLGKCSAAYPQHYSPEVGCNYRY